RVYRRALDPSEVRSLYTASRILSPDSPNIGTPLNDTMLNLGPPPADISSVSVRRRVGYIGNTYADGIPSLDLVDRWADQDVECCPPSDGVIATGGGDILNIEFSGNFNLNANDTVIFAYDRMTNPGSDDNVEVSINPSSGDDSKTGTLEVDPGSSSSGVIYA
ncbi:MAG: hypothetical protein SV760_03750, partial [Halobacteria archaeon]|nr:hypothetical protein [Halobacteria archaeon]